jgi:hypothetical protein
MTRHSIIGVVLGAVVFFVIVALCFAILKDRDQRLPAAASIPAPIVWGMDKNALPGATLEFAPINLVENADSDADHRRFTLEVPVLRSPTAAVNVTKLVIQVFLYDQLDNGEIVRTDADIGYHWASLPADWVKDDVETLKVDYSQKPHTPGTPDAGRHFYGYAADIYYEGSLQSTTADPASLLKEFPLPQSLKEQ